MADVLLNHSAEDDLTRGSMSPRQESSSEGLRCVAAIDIGTNSTHLLVASVDPYLQTFNVSFAEKSTTRLGEVDSDSGNLTEAAMERTLFQLKRFKELADSYKVEEIVTAATSAVREAPNCGDFLFRIKKDLNLSVDLVSGFEEARLIYLGVLSGISFGDNSFFLIDIGGGSTELILADSKDARALTSTKIGAVRLQRDFIREEPISLQRRNFLQTFIEGSLEPAVEKIFRRVNTGEMPLMIATSGTAMSLCAIASSEDQSAPKKMHGYKLSLNKLGLIVDKLIGMNLEQRRNLLAINSRRAEIIVPGALILQTAMKMLSVDELMLSERALREGLIVDWMLRKGLLKDKFVYQRSIRQRTIAHQARRFKVDELHAKRVAKHALNLYENTKGVLHQDSGSGYDLLWAASMLHACGKHINLGSYHKHSWYLIRHGELLGYSQIEHLMVAAIARYHRKSLPKKRHEAWQVLTERKQRQIVLDMSLLLRLATVLECRPEPSVKQLQVKMEKKKIYLKLLPENPSQDLSLEKWSLENCRLITREVSGVDLDVII